jgi:hypothetical protein
MSRPAFIEIDGKLGRWRDLLAQRREELRAQAAGAQPTLFELKRVCRPASEPMASGRFREPTLFADIAGP